MDMEWPNDTFKLRRVTELVLIPTSHLRTRRYAPGRPSCNNSNTNLLHIHIRHCGINYFLGAGLVCSRVEIVSADAECGAARTRERRTRERTRAKSLERVSLYVSRLWLCAGIYESA
jgi:hypothetical protein